MSKDVLQKIKNQKNCYVLETQSDKGLAEIIRAYYIDGICYFVSFQPDFILRVHYVRIG